MTLKQVGLMCKTYRRAIGFLQRDVAADTGYSVENISAFERGRNDNLEILLWYFGKGMTYQHLKGDKIEWQNMVQANQSKN